MVLPILNSNYTEGSGVLVGNLFITAGHVICDAQDPHVKLNGVIYNLDSSREILFRNDKDENGYDLAVYRIPEVCSDLKLMPEFPRSGTRIGSISYRMSRQGYDKVECTATVGEISCFLKNDGVEMLFSDKICWFQVSKFKDFGTFPFLFCTFFYICSFFNKKFVYLSRDYYK